MSLILDELKRLNLFKPYNRGLWRRRLGLAVSLHGIKLPLHKIESARVVNSVLRGSYEADEASSLRGWLRKNDRVLELGTGFGFVTCLAAKAAQTGKVLSYEANPHMVKLARETLDLNDVNNVEVCQAIVANSTGTTSFYLSPHFWESSLSPNPNWKHITVPTLNLSEVLSSFQPTAVIIDIEGGEYELLKSTAWNEVVSIQKLSIEFHKKSNATKELEELTLFSKNWKSDTSLQSLTRLLKRGHATVTFTRTTENS